MRLSEEQLEHFARADPRGRKGADWIPVVSDLTPLISREAPARTIHQQVMRALRLTHINNQGLSISIEAAGVV